MTTHLASTSSETPLPVASVEVVADEIEVEWLPEATVQIIDSGHEIFLCSHVCCEKGFSLQDFMW